MRWPLKGYSSSSGRWVGKLLSVRWTAALPIRPSFAISPDHTILIGRIRKDARLFDVPEPTLARRGRKRWYGEALHTPEQVRQNTGIPWQAVSAYASGTHHQFEVKALPTVRWQGTEDKTVSVIIIRPLAYRPRKGSKLLYRNTVYLLCTDPTLPLERVLQSYLWRWEIGVNFRDEKTVMGSWPSSGPQRDLRRSSSGAGGCGIFALLLAAAADEGKTKTCRPQNGRKNPGAAPDNSANDRSLFRSQLLENRLRHE